MNSVRVGRPKGEDLENARLRRKQLIDATVELIVDHGLSATTLATVARASGLSQGTAVFYFKTKDALLSEAFRYREEEYRTAWKQAVALANDDPVDRIVAMVFASLDPRLLTRKNLAFWNAFWPEVSRLENLHGWVEQLEAERQQVMRNLFDDAGELLRNSIWTPQTATQVVETMVEGIWVRLHYSSAHMTIKEAYMTMGLLLCSIFPVRTVTIMKRATSNESSCPDE